MSTTTVSVSPNDVRLFGQYCLRLAEELAEPEAQLSSISPAPGNFDHGNWYAQVLRYHSQNATEKVSAIRDQLIRTGNALIRIARDYRNQEELNKLTGEALLALVNQTG